MSNYNNLKSTINANIKTNGNEEITGFILNSVLNEMVTTIGAGYIYAGAATPSGNPGSPDANVFFLAASVGTYTHFGGFEVNDGEIAFLRWNGTWSKDSINVASTEVLEEMQDAIDRINTELGFTGGAPIPIAIPPSCGATINNENLWYVSSSYYGGLVDVTNYRGYTARIQANPSVVCDYAFLKSGVSAGNTPDYATGYSQKVSISAGTEESIVIPSDAVYLYVYLQSPGVDFRPTSITFIPPGTQQTRLEEIEEDIADLTEELAEKTTFSESINTSSLESCGGSINNSTKKWVSVSGYYASLIPITGAESVKIKANASRGATYTFLKTGISVGDDANFASGYSGVVSISAGTETQVQVPTDAVLLYIYLQSPGINYTPQAVTIFSLLSSRVEELEKEVGDHLSLFTYNIGHFSLGVRTDSTITAAQYPGKVDAFRALLSTQKPNVFGVVEYSAIFGKNSAGVNVNTKEELFNFQDVEFESTQMNYACYALFGNNVPLYNIAINDFDCLANETITHTTLITAQDYRFISADMYAFGLSIKLIVTHLAFDSNRPGVLQTAQINELISKFSSYDYVVMMGDWNVSQFSEFNAFVNAGYTLANDGSLITYPGSNKALDNIVVKGLTISHVKVVNSPLSDHFPLLCYINK